MRVELTTALALAAALVSMPALGQTLNPGPPGPFVIDIRGATAGLPTSSAMYPVPPAPTTTSSTQTSSTSTSSTTLIVPTRGFGFDAGAHVYLFGLGPARIGIGANVVWARGTTSDAEATMDMVVPQLSFNFGTANGWSYLSGGIGPARVKTTETFNTHSVNGGGGARWFLNDHTAISFDIRMHKLSAKDGLPRTTLVSASVGLSLK